VQLHALSASQRTRLGNGKLWRVADRHEGGIVPVLDLFWTVLLFCLFVALVWLVIMVFTDILRSRDLSGWAKALWVVFVVIIPWLGVLVYLVVRGRDMARRKTQWAFGEDM
jgi:hypothetical protein